VHIVSGKSSIHSANNQILEVCGNGLGMRLGIWSASYMLKGHPTCN